MSRNPQVWNPKNKYQRSFIKRHKPIPVNQLSQPENANSLNEYNLYRAFSSKLHRHPLGRSFLIPEVELKSTRHTKILRKPSHSLPSMVQAKNNKLPKYVYV